MTSPIDESWFFFSVKIVREFLSSHSLCPFQLFNCCHRSTFTFRSFALLLIQTSLYPFSISPVLTSNHVISIYIPYGCFFSFLICPFVDKSLSISSPNFLPCQLYLCPLSHSSRNFHLPFKCLCPYPLNFLYFLIIFGIVLPYTLTYLLCRTRKKALDAIK